MHVHGLQRDALPPQRIEPSQCNGRRRELGNQRARVRRLDGSLAPYINSTRVDGESRIHSIILLLQVALRGDGRRERPS